MTSRKLIVALLLYVLTLGIRLPGILSANPQTDEIHWLTRSHSILEAYQARDIMHLTTRLGHPGVPPALIMAGAEWLAARYPGDIDQLGAARLTMAGVGSLASPLLFLFLSGITGTFAALFAALFLTVDPQHVANTRVAHLDGTLAVFVLLSVFCYGSGVLTRRPLLKLLAGCFWGLAVATKPTALALVPAFLLWKCIVGRFGRSAAMEAPVVWSDLWTLIAGHVVFAAIYTRFWVHESDYKLRLQVKSSVADLFYQVGTALGTDLWLPLVLGAILVWLAFYFSRSWWAQVATLLAFLLVTLACFPQVYENILRFWTWTAGLSGMTHKSLGYEWPQPRWGYTGLFLSKLPTLSIVCFLGGLVALRHAAERVRVWTVLFLLVLIIWPLILGVSSKQAFRYVIPVVGLLYAVAGYGVSVAADFVSCRVRPLFVLLPLWNAVLLFQSAPDYFLFHNTPTGGLRGASARGEGQMLSGQNAALRFIFDAAKAQGERVSVAVLADTDTVRFSFNRLYPRSGRATFRFLPDIHPGAYISEDFVFVVHSALPAFRANYRVSLEGLEEVFRYEREGVVLTSVFRPQNPDFSKPVVISLASSFRRTGHNVPTGSVFRENVPPKRDRGEMQVRLANPEKDAKGFLYFGRAVRLEPGRYRLSCLTGIPNGTPPQDENTLVMKHLLGSKCEREVRVRELEIGASRPIEFECDVSVTSKRDLSGYWFGKLPVYVESCAVMRIPGARSNAHSGETP